MENQNIVMNGGPCNLVVTKIEKQPRQTSFKTLLDRFYLDAIAQPTPEAARQMQFGWTRQPYRS